MKRGKLLLFFLILFTLIVSLSFYTFGKKDQPKPKHYNVQKKFKKHVLSKKSSFKIRKKPFRFRNIRYVPDQVLVKFNPHFTRKTVEAVISAYDSHIIKKIPRVNVYKIHIPDYASVEEMIYIMDQNPDVEYVEPNFIGHVSVTPNDSFFNWQYSLYNSGQEIWENGPQGTPRADIKATEAWEETKGSEDVLIGVLDTGVDMLHKDIENNIHSPGRDFVNDDYDATDDHWHGTHVAGIIAAETNNNRGIAGVAWNCKILPVKVADDEGEVQSSSLSNGIIWAADNDADIINISLGIDLPAQTLEDALEYAYGQDCVIVAAVGDTGNTVQYPAAYDDYCMAVALTDYDDVRLWWSNFGPQVDVAAPGVDVLSLMPTWLSGPEFPYAWKDGTSMSAPHVSGLAALIRGIKPWLENWEIMDIIRYSADDVNSELNPGKDDFIGYGRINMEKALVPLIITSSHKGRADSK